MCVTIMAALPARYAGCGVAADLRIGQDYIVNCDGRNGVRPLHHNFGAHPRQHMPVDHSWNVSPQEAARIQQELRPLVRMEDDFGGIRLVAGADLSFHREERMCRAAMVVVRFPDLDIVEEAAVEEEVRFPYVPGLLAFREAPAIISVYHKLRSKPDLLVLDGHGYAHPRRFGVTCHVGLALDVPAIGCAKSRLVGAYDEPNDEAGAFSSLIDEGEIIGAALRTRAGAKPVFVSIGHRVCLESAMMLTMQCVRGYRLPEPTRLAHRLASEWIG